MKNIKLKYSKNICNIRLYFAPHIKIDIPILNGSPKGAEAGFKYYLPSLTKLQPMHVTKIKLSKEEFDEYNKRLDIELRFHNK